MKAQKSSPFPFDDQTAHESTAGFSKTAAENFREVSGVSVVFLYYPLYNTSDGHVFLSLWDDFTESSFFTHELFFRNDIVNAEENLFANLHHHEIDKDTGKHDTALS